MNQSTMSSSYSQDFPKSSANVYFEVAHPFRIASIHSPNPPYDVKSPARVSWNSYRYEWLWAPMPSALSEEDLGFSWSYGSNKASVVMSGIEYIVSVICIGLTFLVYILIAVSIYRMTRGVVSVKRREIVLVVHAALLFFTLTTLITCWHYYSIFLPESVWTYFSINIYWMLYCGLNPILHMAFSKCANAHFLVTFHWMYGPAER
ncbi:hypothetical protein RB195_015390 [Necator americanus]|uniref:7TM GPCR serpentine receptor class x (Srx) domain-containing protein n=1 Tax=Necator americanus TaxID=51031 RepID=A0ABR1E4X2_NECAM